MRGGLKVRAVRRGYDDITLNETGNLNGTENETLEEKNQSFWYPPFKLNFTRKFYQQLMFDSRKTLT